MNDFGFDLVEFVVQWLVLILVDRVCKSC